MTWYAGVHSWSFRIVLLERYGWAYSGTGSLRTHLSAVGWERSRWDNTVYPSPTTEILITFEMSEMPKCFSCSNSQNTLSSYIIYSDFSVLLSWLSPAQLIRPYCFGMWCWALKFPLMMIWKENYSNMKPSQQSLWFILYNWITIGGKSLLWSLLDAQYISSIIGVQMKTGSSPTNMLTMQVRQNYLDECMES